MGGENLKAISSYEMVDVVKVGGKARGIIVKNLIDGSFNRFSAHAVVLATGGYGNVYYLSTNAMGSNVTASWRVLNCPWIWRF